MDDPESGPGSNDREAGFVLLSVLLAVALFMAAAASFAVKSRLAAMQAANRIEQAETRALADGAVLFAVDALSVVVAQVRPAPAAAANALTRRPPLPFPPDGAPLSCALSGGRGIELSVVDQAGLVDLNAAPPEMIGDVLAAAGLNGETARAVAGAIVDFRDANDVPEAGGASEAALYREAGKPFGPRNGAFLDAAEIAQLPAVPPNLAARLQPLFTVFNARAGFDVAVMDRRARALLPKEVDGLATLARWRQPTARRAFSVEAALRRPDGTVAAARHGLVAFGQTDAEAAVEEASTPRPPRILQWREMLVPPETEVTVSSSSPLCERLRRALDTEPARSAAR